MLNAVLEIARGLAALWVFLYHLRFYFETGLLRRLADGGFLGVPLFFVISGYCMMASSRGVIARGQPAWHFLKRRLRRIFPAFWLSIGVAVIAPFMIAIIYGARSGTYQWPAMKWSQFTALDWVGLVTLTKGLLWLGPAHRPYSPVNAVYWSLAIEVQFYLVMSIALVFRGWFNRILTGVSVICLAIWAWHGPYFPGLFGEYWPMFALGLLLFGLLDGGIRPERFFGRHTAWMSAGTATGCLLGALALVMFAPSESLNRQTLFAVCSAVILWAASGLEPRIPLQAAATRALMGLGKMSYSVYLLHLHMVSLAAAFVVLLSPRATAFVLFLRVALALVFCRVFYEVCEKRFATSSNRLALRRDRGRGGGWTQEPGSPGGLARRAEQGRRVAGEQTPAMTTADPGVHVVRADVGTCSPGLIALVECSGDDGSVAV